jgi:hypothetical protein
MIVVVVGHDVFPSFDERRYAAADWLQRNGERGFG